MIGEMKKDGNTPDSYDFTDEHCFMCFYVKDLDFGIFLLCVMYVLCFMFSLRKPVFPSLRDNEIKVESNKSGFKIVCL